MPHHARIYSETSPTVTVNPYFFHLVWQWWGWPHPHSTFPRGWRSLMVAPVQAHLIRPWRGGGGSWVPIYISK